VSAPGLPRGRYWLRYEVVAEREDLDPKVVLKAPRSAIPSSSWFVRKILLLVVWLGLPGRLTAQSGTPFRPTPSS